MSKFQDEINRMMAAAERGMTKAMIELQKDTMSLTHVYPKNGGSLRRSWTHEVNNSGSEVVGAVGSNLKYAKYEDALHPNISEALESNVSKYYQTIGNELEKR